MRMMPSTAENPPHTLCMPCSCQADIMRHRGTRQSPAVVPCGICMVATPGSWYQTQLAALGQPGDPVPWLSQHHKLAQTTTSRTPTAPTGKGGTGGAERRSMGGGAEGLRPKDDLEPCRRPRTRPRRPAPGPPGRPRARRARRTPPACRARSWAWPRARSGRPPRPTPACSPSRSSARCAQTRPRPARARADGETCIKILGRCCECGPRRRPVLDQALVSYTHHPPSHTPEASGKHWQHAVHVHASSRREHGPRMCAQALRTGMSGLHE